ncbi:hypothetical protein [Marinobacter sp. EVN1]|uniref:hypothetical protein n=1 Tax=Marinobacter sp. EVN1 TaxID=1397532 RepID=UPI001D0D481F|nr:hypothetical protein [Marinobacter sp. EVN1]
MALRIPVTRFEKEVAEHWRVGASINREGYLDRCLAQTRPCGANGDEVCSLDELERQLPLTKKQLREATFKNQPESTGFARHTAGTTGEPTNISLSREELARMLAVRAYCYRKHGLRLGQREARIWGRADATLAAKLRDFLLNRKVFYPAENGADKVVSSLIDWRPEYLYGYSSLILEAARIVTNNKLRPAGIKAIICTAEAILPSQKEYISKAFNAPVLEEYGSTEFDIIAFECKSGHLHLVNPWLWVETWNGEALISDVTRTSQSLVRYRLGDSFTLANSGCRSLGSEWVIDELRGRSIHQFAYLSPSEKFHAVVFGRAIDRYMSAYGEHFMFNVRQLDYARFVICVSEAPGRGLNHFEVNVIAELRELLSVDDEFGLDLSVRVDEDVFGKGGHKYTYFFQDLVV